MDKGKWLISTLLFGGVVGLFGCGSIMHGASQDIGFTSTPSGAKVTLDNRDLGVTPIIAKLSRKDNHVVKFVLDGYQPADVTLTRSVSGWVWGNLVFGGLVGLAVDAISGGLYKLTPNQVAVAMEKGMVSVGEKDGLFVAVVLRADSAWERVGGLERRQE